jgi:hypothetical protein
MRPLILHASPKAVATIRAACCTSSTPTRCRSATVSSWFSRSLIGPQHGHHVTADPTRSNGAVKASRRSTVAGVVRDDTREPRGTRGRSALYGADRARRMTRVMAMENAHCLTTNRGHILGRHFDTTGDTTGALTDIDTAGCERPLHPGVGYGSIADTGVAHTPLLLLVAGRGVNGAAQTAARFRIARPRKRSQHERFGGSGSATTRQK